MILFQCKTCGIEKDPDEFYSYPTCKECVKKRSREHRKNNLEYYRQYDKKRNARLDRVQARKEYAKSERGREVDNAAKKRWIERNTLKRKAQNMVNNALRDGKITKPSKCECGRTGRIEGHHDDYAKPLEVRWLCVPCHREAHK